MKSKKREWEERFDKKVKELKDDMPKRNKDGEVHEFGFRTNKDDWIFSIIDWHNIKAFIQQEKDKSYKEGVENGRKEVEKPSLDGPLGWIMTLNNKGELTVHPNSDLSYRIQQTFGVRHKLNYFEKKE